ncbi:MAG TPA: hypothetical protein VGD67_20790 [Pseudonocardiaceae bacterium]
MAGDNQDPYANTAAFRAFAAEEPAAEQPTRSGPSPFIYWTAIIALVAIVGTLLAVLL